MTRTRLTHLGMSILLSFAVACVSSAKKGDEEKPTYSMTMKTGKRLQKVGELARDKQWDAALAELDEIAQGKYLNPYERAKLWEARAGIHFALNRPDDVVKDLEEAVALDALRGQERLDALYNLAQAYFMTERFSQSADTFAKWAEDAEEPKPEQQYLIASAFAQAERFAEAAPYAKQAVENNPAPPEPWFQLLVSIHYELKQEKEVAAVLERMVAAYPKKEHWLQLSQTYEALGDRKKARATLDEVYDKGLLDGETELVALARLRLRSGAGAQAAALLEKHMKDGSVSKTPAHYELLAQGHLAAGNADRASAALAGAEEGAAGETYYALAQLEAARGQWAKARDALALAIQRGGLRAPGDAKLLLGIAHYQTKRKDAALASLADAKRHGAATAQCAEAWIKVVKSGKAGAKADCGTSGPAASAQAAAE